MLKACRLRWQTDVHGGWRAGLTDELTHDVDKFVENRNKIMLGEDEDEDEEPQQDDVDVIGLGDEDDDDEDEDSDDEDTELQPVDMDDEVAAPHPTYLLIHV